MLREYLDKSKKNINIQFLYVNEVGTLFSSLFVSCHWGCEFLWLEGEEGTEKNNITRREGEEEEQTTTTITTQQHNNNNNNTTTTTWKIIKS